MSVAARRTSLRLPLFVGLFGLALAGPLAAQDDHPILEKVREIQEDVAEMRGLKFQAPVQAGVQKPADLKKMLIGEFEKEASAKEMDEQARVLKAFGLIPEDYDLRASILKFMSEQIGGFYDPEKKHLFLIDRTDSMGGGMEQKMNDQMVMAHELHHALQDQNFALDRWFDVLGDHEDRIQGYKSLIEGEAQLVGMTYLFEKMGRGKVDMKQLNRMQEMMLKMSPQGAKFRKVPAYLIENMMFPYTQGAEFVQDLQRKQGWAGISKAFYDPPASSEQVLHPEKYYDRDEPLEISLPKGLAKILSEKKEGLDELYENTLGEFNVSLILRALGVKKAAANQAATGWDGDRFVGLRVKEGDRLVVIWLSTWDSEQDAAKFERVYRGALARKGSSAHLERRGSEVLWIHGATEAETPKLARKAFQSLMVENRYRPTAGLLAKPPLSDFTGKAEQSHAQGHGHGKVERPAATSSDDGLVRVDEVGVSFVLPEGFKSTDEPQEDLREITRAYFRGESQELRVFELPVPFEQAMGSIERALTDRGMTIEKKGTRPWGGVTAGSVLAKQESGKHPHRVGLMLFPSGGRTVALGIAQKLDAPLGALRDTAEALTNTLWLDTVGGEGEGPKVQKLLHAEHRIHFAHVFEKQVAGAPEYGRIHAQEDSKGGKVAVSSRPTSAALGAIAKRTLKMLSLAHKDVEVVLEGVVKRGDTEIFELEHVTGGRRVRQRTLLAGGQRWTVTCSAPADDFDAYRKVFGEVLRAFRVEKANKKKVY